MLRRADWLKFIDVSEALDAFIFRAMITVPQTLLFNSYDRCPQCHVRILSCVLFAFPFL